MHPPYRWLLQCWPILLMICGTTQLHDKVHVEVLRLTPWWVVMDVYAVHKTKSCAIDYEVVHREPDDSAAPLQGCARIWLNTGAPIEHLHVVHPHGGLQ